MSLFLNFFFYFVLFYDFFFIPTSNPLLCTLFFLQLVITKRLRHVTVHPPLRQVSQRKSPGLPDRGLWLLQSETRVSVTKKKKFVVQFGGWWGFCEFLTFCLYSPATTENLVIVFLLFFPWAGKRTARCVRCRPTSFSKHCRPFKDRLTPCWSLIARPTIWPTVSSIRPFCSSSAIWSASLLATTTESSTSSVSFYFEKN